LIELRNVTRSYPARKGDASLVRALDNVSLTVAAGEWLAIMGPSGSGKSTLVNLIGCLDLPTAGEILVDGQSLAALSAAELTRFRAEKIGFVFQQFHLIPYLTALENVMLAQYFHSMSDRKEAMDALARIGLADRAHHLPAQLSGGEQQRVCVARALINDPKIILADEPTGNLDAENEEVVLHLLSELHAQGHTIVMVTHDSVVARMADRRLDLHHGRIVAEEVFATHDEEQFDEVLEELWVRQEESRPADIASMHVAGPLPVSLAVERMAQLGLVSISEKHAGQPSPAAPSARTVLEFTDRGRHRAADIIRRHRLAERLFTDTLHMQDDAGIEAQACKFEHILSPEATESICVLLGHPKTCPHGSPIPPGECCVRSATVTGY
jgi:putative ABC transport system ATP-binding protein